MSGADKVSDSLHSIKRVQISICEKADAGLFYKYAIFSDERFTGGNPTIALSKSKAAKSIESRVATAGAADWYEDNGDCYCIKSDIDNCNGANLYAFLFNAQDKASNSVRVFTKPPVLKSFQFANNDLLYLEFDISADNHKYAQEIHITNKSADITVKLKLPECSVLLRQLGIWRNSDDGKFTFILDYYTESDDAPVSCQSLGEVTLKLFGPDITNVAVNNKIITCICKGAGLVSGCKILAEIIHENRVMESAEFAPDILSGVGTFTWENIGNFYLDYTNIYTIRARFKEGYGLSLPGREMPIIMETPVLLAKKAAENGKTELIFNKIAQYEVTAGDNKKLIQSDRITVDGNACVTIRRVLKNSFGSALSSIDAKCFRYTSFKYKEQYFYMLGYKGAEKPASAIKTDIDAAFLAYNSAGAKVFSIKKEEAKCVLAIDVSIIEKLIDSPKDVYDDFEAMLEASCSNNPFYVYKLTYAVINNAPLRAVDVPIFLYRWRVDKGTLDLMPGMVLCADDKNYQVIRRRKNIRLEPFVQAYSAALSYVVPPFPGLSSEVKAVGASGIADILFEGLAAPFVRLVYPKERLPRNSQAEQQYFRSINIAAAPTLPAIAEAAQALREQRLPDTEHIGSITYASMRGCETLIPKIAVYAGGALLWVSLGTTVGDIMDNLGGAKHGLIIREGYPVFGEDIQEIPLIMGDNLEVNYGGSK